MISYSIKFSIFVYADGNKYIKTFNKFFMLKSATIMILAILLVVMGYYQCYGASNECYTKDEVKKWKTFEDCVRLYNQLYGVKKNDEHQDACIQSVFKVDSPE